MNVTVADSKLIPLLRGCLAAGLYAVAVFVLLLALPAVGEESTPTSDPDTAAGAALCLVLSTLFLAATAGVARTWTAVRVACLAHLAIVVTIATRVPSSF
ncbi:hypothetical protein ABZZ36_29880 [Actinacidiphila glaucinigra]|uniref:hypothetical protein n=1 Tax=Actinacidiphila glaucinigra TaxID=235986 RepID=UPI0033BFA459